MTPDLPLIEPSARAALQRALAQLDDAETRARPFEMSQTLAAVARCYRDLRAIASAEASFAAALRWAHLSGAADPVVDLLCELAETSVRALLSDTEDALSDRAALRAARERARDRAFEAARRSASVADPRWEVCVLLRVSAVLEQCGDHDDALALQSRALRLQAARRSASPDPGTAPRPRRPVDA